MTLAAPRPADQPTAQSITTLTASIYLILLAFFVVLTAASQIEPSRSEEVLESVTKAFGSGPSRIVGTQGDDATVAPPADSAERYREVAALFENWLALVQTERSETGRLMQIIVPTASMFEEERVLPKARALLARITETLWKSPSDRRFRLEFVTRTDARAGPFAGASQPSRLGIDRAGSAARAMTASGAPANAVSVSLENGDPAEVRFLFRTIERQRDSVTFRPETVGQ